jgi:predicted MFS family arabinose efflux permease
MVTVTGFWGVALAAGAALGGVIQDPLTLIYILVAINLLAAAAAGFRLTGHRRWRWRWR